MVSENQLINTFRNVLSREQNKQSNARISALVKTASKIEHKLNKKATHEDELLDKVLAFYDIKEIDVNTRAELSDLLDKVHNLLVGDLTEPAAPPTEHDPEMIAEMEPEIPRPPRVPTFATIVKKFEQILKDAR